MQHPGQPMYAPVSFPGPSTETGGKPSIGAVAMIGMGGLLLIVLGLLVYVVIKMNQTPPKDPPKSGGTNSSSPPAGGSSSSSPAATAAPAAAASGSCAASSTNLVQNANFSSPVVVGNSGDRKYYYTLPTDWQGVTKEGMTAATYDGGSLQAVVIIKSGSADWGGVTAPGGQYVALQNVRKLVSDPETYLQQTITKLTPGCKYTVTVRAMSRPGTKLVDTAYLGIMWGYRLV